MILFFDVETNGKAKNFNAPVTDLDNWPRVTQLAWQLHTLDGHVNAQSVKLIKPDGWTIPTEQFFIDNGMSTERCEAEGVGAIDAFVPFMFAVVRADVIVAHNIAFDYPVMAAEILRYGIKADREHKPRKFCTMKATTDICKLPGKYGYKWPSLIELHQYCFGKPFDKAHDAMGDVQAMVDCFYHLRNNELALVQV